MSETGLDRRSTPSLIGDALGQVASLFSAEVQLARLEMTEKLVAAVVAVIAMVVAAVFTIVALIFLLQGVVELLVHAGLALFVSSFIVGGAILVFALIAILLAARSLSKTGLKPERTIRQAKGAAELVGRKGAVS